MFTIAPRGPFSLAESAGFAYIDRDRPPPGPALRLAFCRDGSWAPIGVSVTQRGDTVQVHAAAGDRPQVERVLSLDVDASSFADVGARDPVIGRLQAAAPGLRPPLMHSAYEAAVFCILTARRSSAQARRMRALLAEAAGTVLDVDGDAMTCLPPPAYLVDPAPVAGLDPVRRSRLQAVAQAALDGRLDTSELSALPPEQARARLEQLPGIGPFSSAIIVVRALGHTDVLAGPITELNSRVGELYDLGHDANPGRAGPHRARLVAVAHLGPAAHQVRQPATGRASALPLTALVDPPCSSAGTRSASAVDARPAVPASSSPTASTAMTRAPPDGRWSS